MSVRALLFDIGNVLLRFDLGSWVRRVAPHARIHPDIAAADLDRIKQTYESGGIGRAEFVRSMQTALDFGGPEADLVEAWCDIFEENRPMTDIVRAFQGRLPMHLLSNTNDLHLEFIRERFPVFALLPEGVYSHEAGCMKPEPRIFELAVARFDIVPAHTLYIDDLAPNIATAEALGFRCVHYHPDRHATALEVMRGHGLGV
jgi:FMN phosphatase YigB (HAD superfamily)